MKRRRLSRETDPAFDPIEGKIVNCRRQDESRGGDVTLALESMVGEKVENVLIEKGGGLALDLYDGKAGVTQRESNQKSPVRWR